MKLIKLYLSTFFVIMTVLLNPLFATSQDDFMDDIRILNLIPNLVEPLAVDPAIPDDFVAMSLSGKLDPCDWIYWGPKGVLERYFADEDSLDQPIIRVKLSMNVSQTEMMREDYLEIYKAPGVKVISSEKMMWGCYPVLAITTDMQGQTLSTAHVGVNAPGDWVLLFNLVYPEKHKLKAQSDEDRAFWNHFIHETKLLHPQQFSRAHGQDLRPGVTMVDINGSRLKVMAQLKEGGKKLRIVATPLHKNLKIELQKVYQSTMLDDWHKGEPITIVEAVITKKGKSGLVKEGSIYVLTEVVKEFLKDEEILSSKGKRAIIAYCDLD